MSMPHEIEVTCNDCGSKQAFTAWQSLNASLSPNAKEALMKGELMCFLCGQCGSFTELVYPLLYHDMERQLMVSLVIANGAPESGPLPVDDFMHDYLFRVVSTRNQLVEKIRIFEAGFDDRVLEFVKLLLRRGAANAGRALVGDLLFNGRGQTESGESGIQFLLTGPDGIRPMMTPISQLTEIICDLGDKLPPYESESGKWLVVDENYAANLASKF